MDVVTGISLSDSVLELYRFDGYCMTNAAIGQWRSLKSIRLPQEFDGAQVKMVSLSLLGHIFRTSKIANGALVTSPNWPIG